MKKRYNRDKHTYKIKDKRQKKQLSYNQKVNVVLYIIFGLFMTVWGGGTWGVMLLMLREKPRDWRLINFDWLALVELLIILILIVGSIVFWIRYIRKDKRNYKTHPQMTLMFGICLLLSVNLSRFNLFDGYTALLIVSWIFTLISFLCLLSHILIRYKENKKYSYDKTKRRKKYVGGIDGGIRGINFFFLILAFAHYNCIFIAVQMP